jgi:hypothetical protein
MIPAFVAGNIIFLHAPGWQAIIQGLTPHEPLGPGTYCFLEVVAKQPIGQASGLFWTGETPVLP